MERKMTRTQGALLCFPLVLLLGSGAMAASSEKMLLKTGEIKTIDVSSGTIAILEKGGAQEKEVTFSLDPKTTVTGHSKKMKLGDLKGGDRVNIHYEIVGGKKMARSIALENPFPPKKPMRN